MAEQRPDDEADGELVSRFRSPPGWSVAIERVAAASFDVPLTAEGIALHFVRLAEIICQELPDSDERERLLIRLVDLERAALVTCGALRVH